MSEEPNVDDDETNSTTSSTTMTDTSYISSDESELTGTDGTISEPEEDIEDGENDGGDDDDVNDSENDEELETQSDSENVPESHCTICDLPPELEARILLLLPMPDIFYARLVCSNWGRLVPTFMTTLRLTPFWAQVDNEGLTKLCDVLTDKFTCLTHLDLGWCRKVNDTGIRALEALATQLRRLSLTALPITNRGLRHLRSLTRLNYLDISCCKSINHHGIKYLVKLTNLRTLLLAQCTNIREQTVQNGVIKTVATGFKQIHMLTGLRELNLRNTNFEGKDLHYLSGLVGLNELNLAYTRITDKSMLSLIDKLTNLKMLNVHRCGRISEKFHSQALAKRSELVLVYGEDES